MRAITFFLLLLIGGASSAQKSREPLQPVTISGCRFLLIDFRLRETDAVRTWEGPCENGLAQGRGILRTSIPSKDIRTAEQIEASRGEIRSNDSIVYNPSTGYTLFSGGYSQPISVAQVPSWARSVIAAKGNSPPASIGQGDISGFRTERTEACNNGSSLLTVVAPQSFNFADGPASRRSVEQLLANFQRQNCSITAVLILSNGAKTTCGARSFDPRLLDGPNAALGHCMRPGGSFVYLSNTLPGRVMNVDQGSVKFWNSEVTPKEMANNEAAEKRAREARVAKAETDARAESAAQSARSRESAELRGSVISTSKPSEEDMRKRIDRLVQINSQGFLRLAGFRKQDGLDMEQGGVKFYQMEWVATLEITKDCLWNNATFEAKAPPVNSLDGVLYASSGFRPAKRGDRIDLTGKTMFRRTERGWRE